MRRQGTSEFSGSALRLARLFHGWTQIDLAEKLEISKFYVAHLESGQKMPTDLIVNAVADLTGFSAPFFYQSLTDEYRADECHLRGRKTTPVNVLNRVLSHGTVSNIVVNHLNDRMFLDREPNIPVVSDVRTAEDIERYSEKCRLYWGLGLDRPISNMVRVLETLAGSCVIKMSFDNSADKIDAFSRAGRMYTAVINGDKGTPSRWRFNLAHELGHLAMHIGMETGEPLLEEQADAFASSFLLPRVGFLREFPRLTSKLDWPLIFAMKTRWKTSASAIIRRAHQLGRIDSVLYQKAYRYMSKLSWNKREPYEFEPEKPEYLEEAFARLAARGETTFDVASRLHISPSNFERATGIKCELPREAGARQAEIIPLALYRH